MADTEHPGHISDTSPPSEKVSETPSNSGPDAAASNEQPAKGEVRADGKRELKENDCYEILGYCWPRWKRWMYLAAIAGVQISMNFNTSVFPSAVVPLAEHWDISEQHARTGQMIYLVTYSIGCELWAPWSEEFGRWPILQLSMFLINIWQIPAALSQNWGTILVARGLVSFCGHIAWTISLTSSGRNFDCWW